jgi:4,5-DOPA dioxygenase extradiol
MHDSALMPVLFLGHGSPMNAIEENEFTRGWVVAGEKLPRPKAVLCISAHWETKGTKVTDMAYPRTIHDFGGFPRELYEVQYPAPGNPELAKKIIDTVSKARIEPDNQWGLDHGCWSVIRHLFPEANIPVVQMSLDRYCSPQMHYELAGELVSLRKKEILIIGSGNMVHNLQMVAWDKAGLPEYGFDWALEAQAQMRDFILTGNYKKLVNYEEQGQSFKLAIPTAEHFLPLLYVLALKEKDEPISLFNDKAVMGSLTMTSVAVGEI